MSIRNKCKGWSRCKHKFIFISKLKSWSKVNHTVWSRSFCYTKSKSGLKKATRSLYTKIP
jgi:hypothetical protein